MGHLDKLKEARRIMLRPKNGEGYLLEISSGGGPWTAQQHDLSEADYIRLNEWMLKGAPDLFCVGVPPVWGFRAGDDGQVLYCVGKGDDLSALYRLQVRDLHGALLAQSFAHNDAM